MKKAITILALSLIAASSSGADHAPAGAEYVWTEPSRVGSAGSMPLGGGDIGMNVWVEPTQNDVYFYLSQSGCFDENNSLLKLGRFHVGWRYRELPSAQPQGALSQSLCYEDGYMTIQTGIHAITLWVDTEKPVVHIELTSNGEAKDYVTQPNGQKEMTRLHPELFVEYESWREQDYPITRDNCQMSSWKWIVPAGTMTHADSLSANRQALPQRPVWFYHQNRDTTVFDYCVAQQRLDDHKAELYNPLGRRIFGGRVTMDADRQHAQIVLCNQQSSLDEWWQQIALTEHLINIDKDRQASRRWWQDYMNRSVIELPEGSHDPELEAALRNVRLFRYMLGCNARGEWPTKFNGGLFTFVTDSTDARGAKPSSLSYEKATSNPDYRKWGGGTHTAQNQRLVYWGMLKSGDTDLLRAQLDYYQRLLPTVELRSRVYWGHEGACYTEQMENFGLPNPAEYGKHPDKKGNGQDPGVENNRWLEYEWDTALEFCQMALEAHRYAGMDITQYEPMILSCLRFFDQHYAQNDSHGKMIIYPGSGCETYKITRNSASTIAALTVVCQSYLRYKNNDEVKRLLNRIPPLPAYRQEDKLCLAPAEAWERINNVETPQLYPVWPWRMAYITEPEHALAGGKPGLYQMALNTYQCDSIALKHRTHIGWKQDNIWAACLGQTDDAYRLTLLKLADGPYRFPAFWGPGYDWSPDHNWGGSALIGLEEMLLQEDPVTGQLLIMPAWPKDKDIHFKLHASGGRIVEVTQKDGQITQKVIRKFGDIK